VTDAANRDPNERTIDDSAWAISEEIGIDVSFFTDENERNLIHLGIIGYVLIHWLLEGVIDALHEELHEDVRAAGATLTGKLIKSVKSLFAQNESSPTEADAQAAARLALEQALVAAEGRKAVDVTTAISQYEEALIGYLVDEGMPARDATRIAHRLRVEAGIQLRLAPAGD